MDGRNIITDEYYEHVKRYMGSFSKSDLIKWRNELMTVTQMDNRLLELFNEELVNRSFNTKEETKKGRK